MAARLLHFGLVAIITVDSGLLPSSLPIPSISTKNYKVGDAVDLFALNYDHQLVQKSTEISAISPIEVPQEEEVPGWRVTNTECYDLFDNLVTMGGVIVDPDDSTLVAFWMEIKHGDDHYDTFGVNFHFYIHPIVEMLKSGQDVEIWSSGCIFQQLHLARAMDLGMLEHHATRITTVARQIKTGPQAIWIVEKEHGHDSGLQLGDFILEIEGAPVGRMADIQLLSRAEYTKALVLRDGKEIELAVKSKRLPTESSFTIICWGGAMLQVTPTFAFVATTVEFARAARKEGIEDLESLVYLCCLLPGSPANAIPNLSPYRWLLEVNKQKVSSMAGLLEVISTLKGRTEDDGYVQVKLISKEGIVSSVGLKLHLRFWPCWKLEWNTTKWVRVELE